MVVNIGDTVSVISEVGLDKGEGKKPEDFLYDPHASSDDSEDESEEGEEGGGKGPVGRRGPPPGRGRRPPSRGRPSPPSEDSGDDDSEDDRKGLDDEKESCVAIHELRAGELGDRKVVA